MTKTARAAKNDLAETKRFRATRNRARKRRDLKRRASKASRAAARAETRQLI